MGIAFGRMFALFEPISIRLTDGAREKLVNFILDSKDKAGTSLYYIVLEGNCVLMTITRWCYPSWENNACFVFYKYFVTNNGHLNYFQSSAQSVKESLCLIEKYISPDGVFAIEDVNKKSVNIFMNIFNDKTVYINWRMLEGELVETLNPELNELRLAMMNELNHECSLQQLVKQTILIHCVKLDQLPLPRQMIDYLNDQNF